MLSDRTIGQYSEWTVRLVMICAVAFYTELIPFILDGLNYLAPSTPVWFQSIADHITNILALVSGVE